MTVRRVDCEDCGRICYERGAARQIEAARRLSGEMCADDFLRTLDPDNEEDADRLSTVRQRFERLARTGKLLGRTQWKHLQNDLWQIKAGDVRLPYYEADIGMPLIIRITHGFLKKGTKFKGQQVRFGLVVIEEDRSTGEEPLRKT